jgi:predicted esterase
VWAAVAPIAPAIFRSPDELQKVKHLPFIVVHGDKDNLVPVSISRRWTAKMKELGMTCEYIEVKGGDHLFPAFQKLPEIFDFFSKNAREAGLSAKDKGIGKS